MQSNYFIMVDLHTKVETTSSGAKVNGDLEVTGSITPTGAKGQKGELVVL